ncbi:MAG TPA: hypothetical protein V6D23_07465, partial [Candidatus Obscuribacterales bacterium]
MKNHLQAEGRKNVVSSFVAFHPTSVFFQQKLLAHARAPLGFARSSLYRALFPEGNTIQFGLTFPGFSQFKTFIIIGFN